MITIYLINVLVFLLVAFGAYKLFKRRARNSKRERDLSEIDLKPFFDKFDLVHEERIRKQWLISFFTRFGLLMFFILVGYLGSFIEDVSTNYPIYTRDMNTAVLVGVPLFSWFTYHCSYKKNGTALLMFIMIFGPFSDFSDLGKMISFQDAG